MEKVSFVWTPGQWISKDTVVAPEDATDEKGKHIKSLLEPVPIQGKAEDLIIFAVMPAVVPTYDSNKAIHGLAPIKGTKSPFNENTFSGIRSGRRSALVKSKLSDTKTDNYIAIEDGKYWIPSDEPDSTLIRLKGCGMWIESDPVPFPGITLQDASSSWFPDKKVQEIRGVAFPRTAATETYATDRIGAMLNRVGVSTGNSPLGFWIYDNAEGFPVPNIEKCVVVMKTVGDKRLETHLLSGIEKIITSINDDLVKQISKNIQEVYEKQNIKVYGESNEFYDVAPYSHLLVKAQDHVTDDISSQNNVTDENLKSKNFFGYELIFDAIKDIRCEEVNIQNLLYLFCLIGHECGRVLTCIHRQGFLWGTYVDHEFCELHCNSHPDNFVILPRGSSNLLSPVDFDMAFEARCAIDFWEEGKVYPSCVWTNSTAEVTNLLSDLCGFSAACGYGNTAIGKREPLHGDRSIILDAFRMCLACEYVKSYDNPSRDFFIKINDGIYDIVERSLEITNNKQS